MTPCVKPIYVTTLTPPPPLGLALPSPQAHLQYITTWYNRERLRGFLCGVIHFPAHGNGINRTIQDVTANFVKLSHAIEKKKVIWVGCIKIRMGCILGDRNGMSHW